MNIIITMAGDGSRFRRAGYAEPKYEITIRERPLFEWSVSSLSNFFEERFIFAARREFNSIRFIEAQCRTLGIRNFAIHEIQGLTDGQATTVIEAGVLIEDSAEPVMIYNIDTYVESEILLPKDIQGDGWVPVFEAEGDKWSFAEFDADLRVTGIAEKIRISPYATIGLYYFSSFNLFRSCYDRIPANLDGERFIAPMYASILGGGGVYAHLIPTAKVHALGTPEDVELFGAKGAS